MLCSVVAGVLSDGLNKSLPRAAEVVDAVRGAVDPFLSLCTGPTARWVGCATSDESDLLQDQNPLPSPHKSIPEHPPAQLTRQRDRVRQRSPHGWGLKALSQAPAPTDASLETKGHVQEDIQKV